MNSLLTKRLPGILALGLVTLAVGAAGSSASAASEGAATTNGATASGAHISGLTVAQKKAKARALKKCKKKRTAKKRRACKRAVVRKYRKLANATPPGKTYTVNLGDNFFTPADVNLKVNDFINWSWANVGGYEPHDVTLGTGPTGVSRNEFISSTTADRGTRFKRQFTKTGKYDFMCSLHFAMTMTVSVSN